MTALDDLIAKETLRELKSRYFRYMDEQDWESLRGILAPDLAFHHPTIGTYDNADETISAIAGRVSGVRTMHQGHDPEIAVDGDVAEGSWSLQSFVFSPTDPDVRITRYARYADRFRREGDGWVISHITFTYVYDPLAAPSAS
jgi:hypothetical protein